jgi:hypothetical protein
MGPRLPALGVKIDALNTSFPAAVVFSGDPEPPSFSHLDSAICRCNASEPSVFSSDINRTPAMTTLKLT